MINSIDTLHWKLSTELTAFTSVRSQNSIGEKKKICSR